MSDWFVLCLCAGWCGVCKDYRPVFERLARQHPEAAFHWVDIEDEAEAMGDYDVETFPTLLIARGTRVHHLGPLTPQPELLARLLTRLQAEFGVAAQAGVAADAASPRPAEDEASALWRRLGAVLSESSRCLAADSAKTQA